MKQIPDELVKDIQVVLDKAIHPKFSWEDVAQIKRSLMTLENVNTDLVTLLTATEVKK